MSVCRNPNGGLCHVVPPMVVVVLALLHCTDAVAEYSSADLEGTWLWHATASGDGMPWWEHPGTSEMKVFTRTAIDATEPATYTVTFDLGEQGTRTGGGELEQAVAHGEGADAPEFDVDDGWWFAGWDTGFDNVNGDLMVTAEYAEKGESILAHRGVNLCGAEFGQHNLPGEYGTDYIYPDTDTIHYFLAKGMTTIRLPFRWERLQRTLEGELDADELARMHATVDTITNAGGTVILDPHAHDPTGYHNQILGTGDVTEAAFADLWSRLAAEFADNERVVFGLINEPHDIQATTWLSAANAAVAAIRDAGAINLILVPGVNWTSSFSWCEDYGYGANADVMAGIVDPADNVAVEVHLYFDADNSGTTSNVVSPTVGRERLADFVFWCRTHGVRGFLGEVGAPATDEGDAVLDDTLSYIETEADDVFLGWTYWAAGQWWPEDYLFSIQPDDPTDLTQEDRQLTVMSPYLPTVHRVEFSAGAHGVLADGGAWQVVDDGAAATPPAVVADDGWRLAGWSEAFDAVVADLSLVAQYVSPDQDDDGLTAVEELELGTDPEDADSDGDLMLDGWEVEHALNPLVDDAEGNPDEDPLLNQEEHDIGTDPNQPDSANWITWRRAVDKLRTIGAALKAYQDDHGLDVFPPWLKTLVDDGYLDAEVLMHPADESGGSDPNPYDQDDYSEVYEEGVSFFYELSYAECEWTLPGYYGPKFTTWYDMKMYQLNNARGWMADGSWDEQAYDRRAFPVVRFFWLPDNAVSGQRSFLKETSLNLAMDLETVFASELVWEAQSDAMLPDDPPVLRSPVEVPLSRGEENVFPIWVPVRDVDADFRLELADGPGRLDGPFHTYTPNADGPGESFDVTVELVDSETVLDTQTYTMTVPASEYTVVFDLGEHGTRTGGGELDQITPYGEDAFAPRARGRNGWHFIRWDTPFRTVTQDLVVTAVYETWRDADLDGMHDGREELLTDAGGDVRPLRDLDGDGYSNLAELGEGTDPLDAEDAPDGFELFLCPGWNLISVGVTPLEPKLQAMLGRHHSGRGWTWRKGTYQTTEEPGPLGGVWVEYDGDVPRYVLVQGDPLPATTLDLDAGWNLIGLPNADWIQPLIEHADVFGNLWYWNPKLQAYRRLCHSDVEGILPGYAYWVYLKNELSIDVGE